MSDEQPLEVNDLVKTRKGANFCGRLIIKFDNLGGFPHGVVEAIEPGFEGSLHVYPIGQLISDEDEQ